MSTPKFKLGATCNSFALAQSTVGRWLNLASAPTLYDDSGLMVNASMADYLVPMSAEMPDIEVAHIQTPTATSKLGAKGAGEAGTAGAPAAVMNAINDALSPFDAHVYSQPITPQKVLRALGKVT